MKTKKDERADMLEKLTAWINQRPGFEPHNYDRAGYLQDCRRVQKQRTDALALLAAVRWHPSITVRKLKAATRAFSGRLQWEFKSWTYCPGQYWCVEYRAAACAVLAQALWDCWCVEAPKTEEKKGDWIVAKARAELGRGIAKRWFN